MSQSNLTSVDERLAHVSSSLGLVSDVNRALAFMLCKLSVMTVGVCCATKPKNADEAGLYLVLRDDLTKKETCIYVRYENSGLAVSDRQIVSMYGYKFVLELERPYLSQNLNVQGRQFRHICNIEYDGHLAITANHGCLYFKLGNACKFCSIPDWVDSTDRSLARLVDAVSQAIDLCEVKHVSFTTGTTPGPDRGIRSILRVIEKISSKVDLSQFPLWAEFEPPDDLAFVQELNAFGIKTVSCNLEFLQKSIREKLIPGKSNISIQKYYTCWEYCVSIFGARQVFSNVILTEDDVNLSPESRSVLKDMIKIKVIPSPGVLYSDPNSELGLVPPISIDKHFFAVRWIARLLFNANLDPRYALAGYQRNGAYSVINESFEVLAERNKC